MLFHSCAPCSLIYYLEQLSISKLCCSHSFPGHLWKFWRTQISVWILLGDSSWPPCYKKWPVLLSFSGFDQLFIHVRPLLLIIWLLIFLKSCCWGGTLLNAFGKSKCTLWTWFALSSWLVQGISVGLWSLTSLYEAMFVFSPNVTFIDISWIDFFTVASIYLPWRVIGLISP